MTVPPDNLVSRWLSNHSEHRHFMFPSSRPIIKQNFSIKGQINILGSVWPCGLCHNYLPLTFESHHRQSLNKWVWLFCNNLIYKTRLWLDLDHEPWFVYSCSSQNCWTSHSVFSFIPSFSLFLSFLFFCFFQVLYNVYSINSILTTKKWESWALNSLLPGKYEHVPSSRFLFPRWVLRVVSLYLYLALHTLVWNDWWQLRWSLATYGTNFASHNSLSWILSVVNY